MASRNANDPRTLRAKKDPFAGATRAAAELVVVLERCRESMAQATEQLVALRAERLRNAPAVVARRSQPPPRR